MLDQIFAEWDAHDAPLNAMARDRGYASFAHWTAHCRVRTLVITHLVILTKRWLTQQLTLTTNTPRAMKPATDP